MKAALISLLGSESTISAICSTRIYSNNAPQGAKFPYLIITQMSSEENGSIDGGSGQLRFLNFDIDCKAKTATTAEQLCKAVREFIDDYFGPAGDLTIGAVMLNDEVDDYEPPQDGSGVGVYVKTLDLDIQYNS